LQGTPEEGLDLLEKSPTATTPVQGSHISFITFLCVSSRHSTIKRGVPRVFEKIVEIEITMTAEGETKKKKQRVVYKKNFVALSLF
jgi:hypothetical protein